ncbi:hypothetical protein EV426DRAFT_701801 [Tirmania nivea]|nr:hypothetical protein EV426DRAFT_701801 [Tirmania nivea]
MPRVSNKRKLTQWYRRGLKSITEEAEAQELVTAALEDAILDGVGLEDDLLEKLEYLADDDDHNHDHDQGSDNEGSVSSISTASSASTRSEEGESLDGEMGEMDEELEIELYPTIAQPEQRNTHRTAKYPPNSHRTATEQRKPYRTATEQPPNSEIAMPANSQKGVRYPEFYYNLF